MQARQLVVTGRGHVEQRPIEVADPGPGEVRVRVQVMAADDQALEAVRTASESVGDRPIGYVVSGTVDALGGGTRPLSGDGFTFLEPGVEVAVWIPEGSQTADVMTVPARRCFASDDGAVSLRRLAMATPLAQSLIAARPTSQGSRRFDWGEDVVIVAGPSPVGFGIVQAALGLWPRTLTVASYDMRVLELAAAIGVRRTVLISSSDVSVGREILDEAVGAITKGRGASVVYVTLGRASAAAEGDQQAGIEVARALVDPRHRSGRRLVLAGPAAAGAPQADALSDDAVRWGMGLAVRLMSDIVIDPLEWVSEVAPATDLDAVLTACARSDSPYTTLIDLH